MYQSNRKAKAKEKKRAVRKEPSRREIYFKILELSFTTDFSVIKKQYRQLAKEHHPDKFARSSELEQNLAHERFLKIQEAYAFFETMYS